MTVRELLSVVDIHSEVKIVGEEMGAYGFVRETVCEILLGNSGLKDREVIGLSITGVENELTITVYGEV